MRREHEEAAAKEAPAGTNAERHRPAANPHARLQAAPALLALQRSLGNRYVQRAVDRPGAAGGPVAPALEAAIGAQRGGGRPLGGTTLTRMQTALGADLAAVRVHADDTAGALSDALEARAFTVGSDIFFGRGQYDPDSTSGRELIAHELTHVLQQTGATRTKLTVGAANDAYEQQADAVARAVVEREPLAQAEQTAAPPAVLLRPETAARALAVQRQQMTSPERVAIGAGAGAVGGAAIGALIGSVVPGVGTLIGAGVGAIIGGIAGGIAGYFAGLRVSIGKVRAASTPRDMRQDRIPPGGAATAVPVSISGLDPAQPPIRITVGGVGGANGTALVNGAAHQDLNASGNVNVTGTVQTAAGSGGNLRLEARQGGTVHATSDPFSVSAIPQNWTDSFVGPVTGPSRGIVVQDGWASDSGTFGDLDETEIAEQVEVSSSTGCFAGTGKHNSGYLAGNQLTQDTHSTPVAILTSPGVRVAEQTSMFKDKRSGATDVPMTNAGLRVTRTVTLVGVGPALQIETKKTGAATTANGITSAAAAVTGGTISLTQPV